METLYKIVWYACGLSGSEFVFESTLEKEMELAHKIHNAYHIEVFSREENSLLKVVRY